MPLNFLNNGYFAGKVGIGVEAPTYTLELQVSQPDENPVVYSQFGGNNGVTGNSFLQIGGARGSAASERYSYLQTLDGAGGFRILSLNPNGGNVGIGTTSPAQKLHINDGSTVTTTDANNMLLLTRNNHSYIMFSCPDEKDSGLHFHNTTDNTFVGRIAYSHESAGDHMLFTVNNSVRMDINYNGDVRFNSYGAGTLVTDSSGNITVSSGGGAGGPYLPLSAGSSYPLTGRLYAQDDIYISGSHVIKNTNNNLFLDSASGYNVIIRPQATEAMRITSAGDVGIGTTLPQSKLQANGGDGLTVTANDTAYSNGYFGRIQSDYGTNPLRLVSRSGDVFRATAYGAAVSILTGPTSGTSEKLRITSAGGVSFGTTGTAYGTSGQILKSNGNASPTWVAASTVIGGPYLPLTAGSTVPLTGDLYLDTPAGASQSGYALKLNKTNSSSQVQVGAEIFATPWASNTNGGTIIFKNADTATNLQETLRISANGSVGINSTSSSYKLDVGGNARFQDSVYINTSTGAGGLYVTRLGSSVESLKIYTSDSTSVFETFQDENTGEYGSMAFILDNGAPDPTYTFKYGSLTRLKIEGGTGDVILGDALLSNQENTDVDTGTETVASVAIATYTAAFFDFVIKKTTNVRSGTVYACHDGTNVEFTETSTQDLGDTSDVTLSVDISGGNMRLQATTTSDDWSIKSLIRAI